MKNIKIGNKVIGENSPTYFIADIAANHDGDLERAKDLIFLCAQSGADAAKFQNFTADKIVSKYGFDKLKTRFSHQSKWNKSVYEIYQDASISPKWAPVLKKTCDKAGVDYFTSAYDFESVDMVEHYVCAYKIGSGDITWLDIIEYIAKKNKPVFLATGASDIHDVKKSMAVLYRYNKNIVLMQCNTNYTGNIDNLKYINLNVLKEYRKCFPDVVLGLSDHTNGFLTVLGAVALGAKVVEKHFTDDNKREGPDHGFAMDPKTWQEMVEKTRELELTLGDGIKRIEDNEEKTLIVQRRALRAKNDIKAGHILVKGDLIPLRPIPRNGIPPYEENNLLGKKINKSLKAGEHLTRRYIVYDKR